MKKTKINYESFLNDCSPPFESDQWIIGGKRCEHYAAKKAYGTAIRVHDPIGFEVGFREWKDSFTPKEPVKTKESKFAYRVKGPEYRNRLGQFIK